MASEKMSAGLFGRLFLWQKFLIVGAVFTVMTAIPSFSFVAAQQEVIDITRSSQEGLLLAKPLLELVKDLARHRGSSTALLNGSEALASEEKATRDLMQQHIDRFDARIQGITDKALAQMWTKAKQDWLTVRDAVINRSVPGPQNFDAHTRLVTQVLGVLERVVDDSGLSLDPKPETYFLTLAVLGDGPVLNEYLGQARGWGAGLLAKAAKQPAAPKGAAAPAPASPVTLQDRAKLGTMLSLAKDRLDAVARSIEKSNATAATGQAALEQPLRAASDMIGKALELSQKEIFAADVPNFPPSEYYGRYTQAINESLKLLDAGTAALDKLFEERLAAARQTQVNIAAGLLGMFLAGFFATVYILRSITRPVSYLVDTVNKLAAGDSSVRANLGSLDEVGLLARQFDRMVDQREAVRVQIQRENDRLNNSVIGLLQAVARLAQRDLTVRVPVAEDITGPVADALNLLSDETAKVLSRVVGIAHSVAAVSRAVKAQSDTVIDVAAAEKREVEQAAAELSEASEAMQDIARLALACNEAANKAIRNTDRAQETVLGTVEGIDAIRDTIRETEKRIKRLGERSQEIGGVVSLINGIAERTHILALNASMHAASAGEAGRGFAVVASEVQKLAESAREATLKISGLVNNIQVETADTVTTMNDAISQVVQGTTMARQAGAEMRETRDTTAELVGLVHRIAQSSEFQAQTTLRLRERAMQIRRGTEETYEQLQDQGKQTERLVEFSSGLVESVGVFVLPQGAPELQQVA